MVIEEVGFTNKNMWNDDCPASSRRALSKANAPSRPADRAGPDDSDEDPPKQPRGGPGAVRRSSASSSSRGVSLWYQAPPARAPREVVITSLPMPALRGLIRSFFLNRLRRRTRRSSNGGQQPSTKNEHSARSPSFARSSRSVALRITGRSEVRYLRGMTDYRIGTTDADARTGSRLQGDRRQ